MQHHDLLASVGPSAAATSQLFALRHEFGALRELAEPEPLSSTHQIAKVYWAGQTRGNVR